MPERPAARTRRLIAERAGFRCEYCLTPAGLAPAPYAAEHILPRSKGGSEALENLAFSCPGCNGHKAARTTGLDPVTRKTVPLYDPRREAWAKHFTWTADATKIEGLSSTGRATIAVLRLNRPGLRNLRRLMVLANLHPPAASA